MSKTAIRDVVMYKSHIQLASSCAKASIIIVDLRLSPSPLVKPVRADFGYSVYLLWRLATALQIFFGFKSQITANEALLGAVLRA